MLGEELIQEFEELYIGRKQYEDRWQLNGEYCHGTHVNFTEQHTAGERINEEKHTSDGIFATRSLASILIGMLWSNGAKSMVVEKSDNIPDEEENKKFFEKASEKLANAMDEPEAGLTISISEYMEDQVAFGGSGVSVFEGDDTDLVFETWGAMESYVGQGKGGKREPLMRLIKWPLRRVVATYGESKLSPQLRKKAQENQNLKEMVEIVQIIKKRKDRDVTKKGTLDMPYLGAVVERGTKHVILETGYPEMPVSFTFFRTLSYEDYGRCPADDALSDVLEQDYLTERFTVNVDKSGDPPLLVMDDGRFGGGIIDTSAGAMNVIDVSGRISNNIDPITPLQTVGELNTTLTRIEQLKTNIAQHFFLDKLLDFNNTSSMTAYETATRDRIRAQASGTVLARQVLFFDKMVSRSFNLMLNKNKFGYVEGSPEYILATQSGEEVDVIPQDVAKAIAKGEDVFKIRYFTPAARIMKAQTLEALNIHTDFMQRTSQTNPEIMDNYDADLASQISADSTGMQKTQRAKEDVSDTREQRMQQMQQQQEQEAMLQGSQVAKNLGE